MKFACFSDLHAHTYKEFSTRSDKTSSSRLDEIIKALEFIRDDCVRRGITHILFAGDLFHIRARVNTLVYNSIYDCMKTFHGVGLEILMIPGNHDDVDNSDLPQHSLHGFKDIEGITVVDTLEIVEFGGVDIACTRYSKNTQMVKDFINSIGEFDKQPILLGHLGVNGGLIGKGSYPMADAFSVEDLRPDFFKYVVLGHFHKSQMLGDRHNVFYCGSPIEHSFSDEGEEKGYYIIDTAKRWDVSFVPIPSPRFISVSATDVVNGYLKDYVSLEDYVRIHVAEKDLQEVLKHIPVGQQYKTILEKTYEEQTRVDVRIGMSEEEVVTKYAGEHNPEALEIGLKILSEVKGNGR